MQKYGDKLPEHIKIKTLMNNWDILDTFFELIDLVGRVIPDGIKHKDICIGIDAKKVISRTM